MEFYFMKIEGDEVICKPTENCEEFYLPAKACLIIVIDYFKKEVSNALEFPIDIMEKDAQKIAEEWKVLKELCETNARDYADCCADEENCCKWDADEAKFQDDYKMLNEIMKIKTGKTFEEWFGVKQ